VFTFLFAVSVFLTLLLSFFSFYKYPQLLPTNVTIEYWENVLIKNPRFYEMMTNTLFIGGMSGILSSLIGFLTGYGLVKMKVHRSNKIIVLYSLPLLMPVSALFMGFHMVMIRLGIIQSVIGVILAHCLISLPYMVNISISYFAGISEEMILLARTLGGSKKEVFFRVVLPLLAPGLRFSMALGFLISVSDYFATFLLGGGSIITMSIVYYPYINRGDYGHASVLSILFVLLNMMVFLWLERKRKSKKNLGGYLYD
jgi:putative spermidine/putrescine transport system permease protein